MPMSMQALPLRLSPGQDLRRALQDAIRAHACEAAFVLSGIGSLAGAQLRLAGAGSPKKLDGDIEILTLAGSIAVNGAHLHASLALSSGEVIGGHIGPGCIVRTTAEVLLALLPGWRFTREMDALTGYEELVVRPAAADDGPGTV